MPRRPDSARTPKWQRPIIEGIAKKVRRPDHKLSKDDVVEIRFDRRAGTFTVFYGTAGEVGVGKLTYIKGGLPHAEMVALVKRIKGESRYLIDDYSMPRKSWQTKPV